MGYCLCVGIYVGLGDFGKLGVGFCVVYYFFGYGCVDVVYVCLYCGGVGVDFVFVGF